MRLAFVGQQVYFHYMALEAPTDGVEPRFVDLQAGAVREQLDAFAPDVVVVFRPELLEPGMLADLDAVTIGFLTEPLPRPGRPSHPDLETRLGYLRAADPANFDRIVSYDPYFLETVDPIVPVWRSLPLPVGDSLFADVRPASGTPRALFTGRATPHRDGFLDPVKHDFPVVHLAHGVSDDRLVGFMADSDVGINLHNEPYPNYENRVSVFLAAGLLVISETLSPRWGLVPGVDYVEIAQPWELWEVLVQLRRAPDAFRTMRLNGRRKAERFRASALWPPLAREAVADVLAFGSARRGAPSVAVP
ncbi:MAG: hypothetical protein HZB46_13350 [Solirubrobacterales bacterium]|nr:hypothetical protein [Solirubrobacterales bacterium]